MKKRELIEDLAQEAGMSKKEAAAMVNFVLGWIVSNLKSGDDVLLSGFGTFVLKEHRSRKAYNPQTKEIVTLPPKKLIKFKPGMLFSEKENLN